MGSEAPATADDHARECLCESCAWFGLASECRMEGNEHACPRCGSATEPFDFGLHP